MLSTTVLTTPSDHNLKWRRPPLHLQQQTGQWIAPSPKEGIPRWHWSECQLPPLATSTRSTTIYLPAQPVHPTQLSPIDGATNKSLREELARLRAQLEFVRGFGTMSHTYRSIFFPFTDVGQPPARVNVDFQAGTGCKVRKPE